MFHVYRMDAPARYTVGAGATLKAPVALTPGAAYDVLLLGPAGLYRRFTGREGCRAMQLTSWAAATSLILQNHGDQPVTWSIRDLAYSAGPKGIAGPRSCRARCPRSRTAPRLVLQVACLFQARVATEFIGKLLGIERTAFPVS